MSIDFAMEGYAALQASSGNEAFLLIQDSPVDIVVSDIRMLNGTGIDLLKNIKKNMPKLPVILLTGFSDYSDQDVLNMGAAAIFRKPFDRRQLLSAVEKALSAKHSESGNHSSPDSA